MGRAAEWWANRLTAALEPQADGAVWHLGQQVMLSTVFVPGARRSTRWPPSGARPGGSLGLGEGALESQRARFSLYGSPSPRLPKLLTQPESGNRIPEMGSCPAGRREAEGGCSSL